MLSALMTALQKRSAPAKSAFAVCTAICKTSTIFAYFSKTLLHFPVTLVILILSQIIDNGGILYERYR